MDIQHSDRHALTLPDEKLHKYEKTKPKRPTTKLFPEVIHEHERESRLKEHIGL